MLWQGFTHTYVSHNLLPRCMHIQWKVSSEVVRLSIWNSIRIFNHFGQRPHCSQILCKIKTIRKKNSDLGQTHFCLEEQQMRNLSQLIRILSILLGIPLKLLSFWFSHILSYLVLFYQFRITLLPNTTNYKQYNILEKVIKI